MAVKTKKKAAEPTDRLLPKLAMWLFGRPVLVISIWLVILVFGIASYTTLLRREGFPSVNIPIAIVNGTYIVNDQTKVDSELAKPISDIAKQQDGVQTVLSQSAANFVTITVQYEESVDGKVATQKLEEAVRKQANLPESVELTYSVPYFGATGGSAEKIDAAVSFYSVPSTKDTKDLAARAEAAVEYLNKNKPSLVENFFVERPFDTARNPMTGKDQEIQKTFDQFGIRESGTTEFYNSVIIAVTAVDNVDVIELDKQLEAVLGQLNSQDDFKNYDTHISASFAPAIEESISELQRVLLEGLIAVLVVGSIVIAMRASLITVLSMITVITATIGLLYLAGYTLNVITLFALILGLALIVDDTIIMVEAIDAARRKAKTPREAVRTATRKISRAMVAATSTAALSFLPLAFVSGVLGTFIRAIPITIISALIISLLVALVFIPLFSKYLLLGKKQMGAKSKSGISTKIEAKVAHTVTGPMRWARGSARRLWSVGLASVAIGISFVIAAGTIFNQVTFNLFPPTKDTNGLIVNLTLPPSATIETTQEVAFKADKIVGETLGDDFTFATYYGVASTDSANLIIELTPYGKRDETSQQFVEQLNTALTGKLGDGVMATVGQVDVGPPASAFTVQVRTENREAGYKLANDVATYLSTAELKRTNGTKASFTNVNVSSQSSVVRSDGTQVIRVGAGFTADDTTTLVTLAQDAVKKEFTESKIKSYGLEADALAFDLGQEAENQESFNGLVLAFPIVLLAIFVLLVIEFRSLLQPLLIFLAIPFSLFGVTLSLYLSDNAFSFFTAMGFFALIGLSIKNTILIVDYANQSRRAGMGAIDAAQAALEERFRPLIATSFTAVVSLIPLAIVSPFWQGLALVLIGGLLSSTFLVVTVFPYYYLGGEYLRAHVSRRAALLWIVSSAAIIWLLAQVLAPGSAFGLGLLYAVLYPIVNRFVQRTRSA